MAPRPEHEDRQSTARPGPDDKTELDWPGLRLAEEDRPQYFITLRIYVNTEIAVRARPARKPRRVSKGGRQTSDLGRQTTDHVGQPPPAVRRSKAPLFLEIRSQLRPWMTLSSQRWHVSHGHIFCCMPVATGNGGVSIGVLGHSWNCATREEAVGSQRRLQPGNRRLSPWVDPWCGTGRSSHRLPAG